jgi:hypothetical protein
MPSLSNGYFDHALQLRAVIGRRWTLCCTTHLRACRAVSTPFRGHRELHLPRASSTSPPWPATIVRARMTRGSASE